MNEEEIKKEVGTIERVIALERCNGATANEIQSIFQPMRIESIVRFIERCSSNIRWAILDAESLTTTENVVGRSPEKSEKVTKELERAETWEGAKETAKRLLLEAMTKWSYTNLAEVALGKKGSDVAKFAFAALVQKMRGLPSIELKRITTEKNEDPIMIRAALDAQVELATANKFRKELGLDPLP